MEYNIVIYGCDNSGKTTLAKNLIHNMMGIFKGSPVDFSYIHSLGPVSAGEQTQFMYKETRRDPGMKVRVFDRFPLVEERICGTVLRGRDLFANDHTLRAMMFGRIDLLIFCDPGTEAIQNWGDREQMAGVKENAMEMYQGYKRLGWEFKECHLENKTLVYNFKEDPTAEEISAEVAILADMALTRAERLKESGGVI